VENKKNNQSVWTNIFKTVSTEEENRKLFGVSTIVCFQVSVFFPPIG